MEAERLARRREKGFATEEQEIAHATLTIQRRLRKAIASRKALRGAGGGS